jgi:hypothetical protein
MNLLLFGGNSQRNKEWIYSVKEALSDSFLTCLVHEYDHWNGKGEFIDFEAELIKIKAEVKDLGEYMVFAKSVGTVLTLMAIKAGILNPTKCLFVGLPLKLILEDKIDLPGLLRANKVTVQILQNTQDPTGSYQEVASYIENLDLAQVKVYETIGDTHSYDDFRHIKTLFDGLIEKLAEEPAGSF